MSLPGPTELHNLAIARGFQAIGVTDVDLDGYGDDFREWLAAGFHGSMDYMARHAALRLNPARLLPGTIRVVSARMNYQPPETKPLKVLDRADLGYVARYALGRDYHKKMRKALARLAADLHVRVHESDPIYRAFADSAPVLEKPFAEKAGLGWIGKNTLLLNKEGGSWFLLGEIFTNAPLTPSTRPREEHCGACRACLTVCPTGALIGPGRLDARRCIAYLTIESKDPIPEALRPAIGNRIFGCDDCQLFCPWNRSAPTSTDSDFTAASSARPARAALTVGMGRADVPGQNRGFGDSPHPLRSMAPQSGRGPGQWPGRSRCDPRATRRS